MSERLRLQRPEIWPRPGSSDHDNCRDRPRPTGRHDLTPQSAGLLAISMGLRDVTPDDFSAKHGFAYDALRLGIA
jgi:hypothetical protein